MFSVEFSSDLVQIQVRETVSGVFLARMDIPIQVWHMVEVMRRDFNEHHITQVPMTENKLGEMKMMEYQSFKLTAELQLTRKEIYFILEV